MARVLRIRADDLDRDVALDHVSESMTLLARLGLPRAFSLNRGVDAGLHELEPAARGCPRLL
jgi:hypothetical protein